MSRGNPSAYKIVWGEFARWKQNPGALGLQLALATTRLWAWVGLYMVKVFEMIFRAILSLPESVLSVPAWFTRCEVPVTAENDCVKIIKACDGKQDVTSKFKLFLASYWMEAKPSTINNQNGFEFRKLVDILQVTSLYVQYVYQETAHLTPGKLGQTVKNLVLVAGGAGEPEFTRTVDDATEPGDPQGYVHFDPVTVTQDLSPQYLDDLESLIADVE
jgi:hypothetical protein